MFKYTCLPLPNFCHCFLALPGFGFFKRFLNFGKLSWAKSWARKPMMLELRSSISFSRWKGGGKSDKVNKALLECSMLRALLIHLIGSVLIFSFEGVCVVLFANGEKCLRKVQNEHTWLGVDMQLICSLLTFAQWGSKFCKMQNVDSVVLLATPPCCWSYLHSTWIFDADQLNKSCWTENHSMLVNKYFQKLHDFERKLFLVTQLTFRTM